MASFEALIFFLGLDLSAMLDHLSCVEVVPGSVFSFVSFVSSASYPADVAWPSSACTVTDFVVCVATAASAAFFCFEAVPLHGLP